MGGWSIDKNLISKTAEAKVKEEAQTHKDSDFIEYVKTKGIYEDIENVNKSIDIAVNLRSNNLIDDATYKTLTADQIESFRSTLSLLNLNFEDYENMFHKF